MLEKDPIKATVSVELQSVGSQSPSSSEVGNDIIYSTPDLPTRMFYAQRYIEVQYDELKDEVRWLRWFHDYMKKAVTIKSLEPTSDNYPKWHNDDLSIRTTHWLVCTGLLTAEIMGAMLVPNSIAMVGYVPGNLMLAVCFAMTLFAGGITWWMFLLLDSPEYPIKTFADIAYLLGGEPCKQLIIFLQVIAMVLTAASSVLGCAEAVVILRSERICWAGVLILIACVQCFFGHIRSLSNLGKVCLAVSFCNYVSMAVQLGYIGEPNWENAKNLLGLEKAMIETFAITPNQQLINKLVAISNISYVFAGSVVFPEILSEMRRPWDFWKSMGIAQVLIFITYMIFGNYIYSKQGQFANSPAVFGISNTNALKGLSFITFLVGFIQAIFYAHLSCKITYKNYLPLIFKRLKFHSKIGLVLWSSTVIFVWACIFIISAGVPQISAIASFTSALTMIPLTYVIPFVFHTWLLLHKSSMEKIHYDSATLSASEIKSSFKTIVKRGIKENWAISTFNIVFSLASMAFAGLGIYGSVEYMKVIFNTTNATSFSCTSPI